MLEPVDIPALRGLCERVGRLTDGFSFPDPERLRDDPGPMWKGLRLDRFLGAFVRGRLVGAMGLWDRTPWSQIRVGAMHPALAAGRRLWELAAGARLLAPCPLPAPGGLVPHVLLDPWVAEPGCERAVIRALLTAATAHLRRTTAAAFAAFGVPRDHPAFEAVSGHFCFLPYWSNIYTVAWPETRVPARPPGRRFRLPLGML